MPLFSYKAIAATGVTEQGEREAADETALLLALQNEGYIPINISPAKANTFLGLRLSGKSKRLAAKDITLFTRELATLLDSGLPLDRALSILLDIAEGNVQLSSCIEQVQAKVKAGSDLADALESQTGIFSKFYINMIRAGEAGGGLAEVLKRLSDYLERSKELRDTVSTALIYPAILLIMSLASLFVMLTFVVPQFSEMFANAGQDLPIPTQIVVALAEFLQGYWWLILGAVFAAISYMNLQLSDPGSKKVWDRRFLNLPLVGTILMTQEVAGLCRTLGTLLGNGVSILKALVIARETVTNLVLVETLNEAEQQLKQGKNMSNALADQGIFPKMALQMIKMGEETGHLEDMFLRVADIYDQQLKLSIQRFLALLEPALIITLGLMIAGIIVSILLAILSVNDLAF